MSNFTRSGSRAKIWQSITNLSCCSIDLITKQTRSMKAFAFIVLFAFSIGTMTAQSLERSTFFDRCQEDAPPGPTVEDVANLYLNQCGDTPAEVIKTSNMSGNDCDWEVEYTYDVKCGDFEEQIKIGYVGGDRTPPTLNDGAQVPTGASGLNLCLAQAPSGPKVSTIAGLYSDNCGEVVVNKFGSPQGTDCEWTANYKYTIMDTCGNMIADLDINYSGGDTQAPQLNKGAEVPTGANGLNLCFDNKPLGPTEAEIAALFSDNCGTVTVTKSLGTEKGNDDCKWLSSFEYTIQDDCGNFADPIYIEYMGGDSENPVLSGVPADTEVSCIDLLPTPANVTATDNCTDNIQVVYTENDDNLGLACEGGEVIRTWTATDLCGNTTSASQTIVVLPAPMAEFEPVSPETISCEEAFSFEADNLLYSNGISKSACSIQGSVPGTVTPNFTICGGTITVNWTYSDDCGRTIDAEKIYTVTPAPAAVLDPIENFTLSCEDASAYVAGSLNFSNGLEGDCSINGSIEPLQKNQFDACGGKILVNYIGEDACGNPLEATLDITVDPAPAPVFDTIEVESELSCADAATYVASALNYSNGLEGVCNISGSVEPVQTNDFDSCGGTITITWEGQDECENPLSASVVIDVLPAPEAIVTAPEFPSTITCADAEGFSADDATFTNGLTEGCEISGSLEANVEKVYDACGGKITITYNGEDACGRPLSAGPFDVDVDPAPEAMMSTPEFPSDIMCSEAAGFTADAATFTNGLVGDCEISGSLEANVEKVYDLCGGKITITYSGEDACGRPLSAGPFDVDVNPAPEASFDVAEHEDISCEEAANYIPSSLAYSNGVEGECGINGSVEGVLSGEFNSCGGLLFVDWTYTDECNRTITARKQLKVGPAPAPTLEEVENFSLSCSDADAYQAGSLAYSNGLEGDCNISGSLEPVQTNSFDECGGTITVTWDGEDICGNPLSASQTITVEPAPMAEFINPLPNINVTCDLADDYIVTNLAYSNGLEGTCGINGEVPGELSGSYDACGGTLYVDWKFVDDCGREIDYRKTITVLPAPAPEVTAPEFPSNIMCSDAEGFSADDATYSNILTGLCEISGSIEAVVVKDYTACGGTITITYDGVDACQNPLSAGPYVITVDPAPEADVTAPQFPLDIECVDAAGFTAADATYSNGLEETACEISGSIEAVVVKDYTVCGGTITITYNSQDECDRDLAAGPFVIEVKPAPAPVFNSIEDDSIACEDLASYVPETLGYSNGIDGDCGINGSVQGVAEPFDGSCGTFEVNFSYESCGVTINASQTITVIDETAPILVGELPQGLSDVNACLADAPAPPTEEEIEALFTDNCGNVNATLVITSPEENTDCLWAVLYRYTIQDDCGNFAAPVKIYHNGGDRTAPELVGDLPEGVTGLQCLSENPGAPDLAAIEAAYTDNCGDVIVTPFEPNIVGDDCGWTATYEYEIKDTCGNKLPNLQIVNSGADTMAPELEGEIPMGMNTVNACKDADLGEPTEEEIAELFSDNCTDITADNVTKIEKLAIGSDCEWIRVFEYIVKDDCNNAYPTFKINYQGGDSEGPMATGQCTDEVMVLNTNDWDGLACPEDATISLETGDEISVDSEWTVGGIPAGQIGSIYGCYTDNCTAVEDLAFTVIGINEDKGTCSTTLTITFDVEDSCGNKSADPLVCTFIINDTTAPVLECPAGEDFGVVTETPEFADKASWTDNCQGSGDTADYTDSEITEEQGDVVYVEGDYVFTFQAGYVLTLGGQPAGTQNDNPYYTGSITTNGNPSPQYGTFEVVFNSTTGEYDVWQDFGDGPFVAGSASADAFETCDPDNWYFIPFNGHNKAFTLECPLYSSSTTYTLVRTFTANDGCGNIGECDVTYTWTIGQGCDDVAPVLDCPAGQDFGIVQAAPTTFDTSVPFTDNNGDGVTTNFTDVDTSEQYFGESTELSIGCIEDGELFAVVNFVRTGFNSDGIAEYATGTRDDAPQFSYELVYDSTSSTWITEEYENGVFLSNIWYSPSTDNAPSCNPAEWDIDSSRCDEIFVDCGFAELDYTEYTKTRTFTATDACDNEASCDVVYTWVIDNEPNFRDTNYNVVPNSDIRSIGLSGSQEESNVDFRAFPVPFDNEVTITYEFDYRTDVTIELFDTKGLLVTNITNGRYVAGSTGRTKIDLSKTPSQVLYVKLTTNQGSVTKKIVSSGKN